MKYIVVEVYPEIEVAVVFPDVVQHRWMVAVGRDKTVKAAGFCKRLENGRVECWGESISVGKASRKEVDAEIVERSLMHMEQREHAPAAGAHQQLRELK